MREMKGSHKVALVHSAGDLGSSEGAQAAVVAWAPSASQGTPIPVQQSAHTPALGGVCSAHHQGGRDGGKDSWAQQAPPTAQGKKAATDPWVLQPCPLPEGGRQGLTVGSADHAHSWKKEWQKLSVGCAGPAQHKGGMGRTDSRVCRACPPQCPNDSWARQPRPQSKGGVAGNHSWALQALHSTLGECSPTCSSVGKSQGETVTHTKAPES